MYIYIYMHLIGISWAGDESGKGYESGETHKETVQWYFLGRVVICATVQWYFLGRVVICAAGPGFQGAQIHPPSRKSVFCGAGGDESGAGSNFGERVNLICMGLFISSFISWAGCEPVCNPRTGREPG